MAEKLKIISLGGLNEIGKNLTVYEYGGDIVVVDCGMGFPDDDMYGIDVVIPDVSYLIKNQNKVRGIFITHGHEDHIGALPYVLRSLNAPIYATRMSAGLIRLKLEEHRLLDKTKIITCEAGDVIKAGKFTVEFIHVNHSIADAVAFAIKCPVGTCVHTGDFKIDATPIQGGMIDLARLGQLGNEGVLALLADSTNVERPGYTRSERSVGNSFDALFKGCEERIIVTTFASNVDRLQQIIDVAFDGYGSPIGSSMYPAFQKYFVEDLTDYYPYDPERARELLAEAGYPDGFSMTITVPSNYQPHIDTATVLVEQLKAVGITAEIQPVEWGAWLSEVYGNRQFQSTVVGVDASNMTARALLERFTSAADDNFINYQNTDYDALFQQAQATADDAEQTELYKQMERNLTEHAANVYIQDLADLVVLRNGLEGYQFYPIYVMDLSTVHYAQ